MIKLIFLFAKLIDFFESFRINKLQEQVLKILLKNMVE